MFQTEVRPAMSAKLEAKLALIVVCSCVSSMGACRCKEQKLVPGTRAFARVARRLAHSAGVNAVMFHRMMLGLMLNDEARLLRVPPAERARISLELFDYLLERFHEIPRVAIDNAQKLTGLPRAAFDHLAQHRAEEIGLVLH